MVRFGQRAVAALAAVSMLVAGCSSGTAGDGTASTSTPPAPSVPALEGCDAPTALFPVEAVLEGGPASCLSWVEETYGRAVRGSTGSAAVWSRRSEHETALIVGAVHSLGLGWFGGAGTAVPEAVVNPEGWIGVPRLFLVAPDGVAPDDRASPWFGLYNPSIAAERNDNLLQDLLPREDFYIAVTDSQKLDVSGLPPAVEPLIRGEVALHDPAGVTTAEQTWSDVTGGELALLLGYPNATGELSASVGRVLTDDEAARAVLRLEELGDPEGSIAYDAAVEMIIEGAALPGMSGGPVVDREGRLVGLLVRATDVHDGVQYVRAVRMSFVVSRLAAALEDVAPADREAIRGYLEPDD